MPDPAVENLTTLANKGEGKTAGSRLGHENMKFQFPPSADQSFEFDKWTNIKGTSTNPSKVDLQGAVAWANLVDCQWALDNWDREKSLCERLLRELFFASTVSENWSQPGVDAADWVTLALKAGVTVTNAPEQWLFKLLVSGAAIAHWREVSGARLNIASANLHQVKAIARNKSASTLAVPGDFDVTTLVFDWERLIKLMRNKVHSWLKQKYPAKASYLAAAQEIDLELTDMMSKANGFRELRKAEYLMPETHGNGYETRATEKLFLGSVFRNDRTADLVIALNHARFIMWMDWRIGTEVCLRVNGGIF